MTEKLYYQDSHLSHFQARVLACRETEKGFEVVLDKTAFYPLGGGQAADTGFLNAVRVLDTREQGEEIIHLCDGALEPGTTVEGKIDYESRFVRMQQHSGEHIVSGIIHRRWGYHNTGFHMNLSNIVIDFDGVIPAEALAEIEAEANQAVVSNIPLHIYTPGPEELAALTYRTKRALPWPVRIVEIPGYDVCACCGTHVSATGEIGLIKLFSAVPFRGGTRMEMACGAPALALMNRVFDQNRQVSRLLSAQITQTGQAVEKLLGTLEEWKTKAIRLEKQNLASRAKEFRDAGDCFSFAEDLSPELLRELTDGAAKLSGGITAVFSRTAEGIGYCLAQPEGDLRSLNKEMTGALSGRGGGKPPFQQGRLSASQGEIRAFFLEKGFREV